MTPKLPDDMREALRRNPDQPLTVEDDQSHAHYVVIRLETFQRLQQLVYDDSDVDPQEAMPLIVDSIDESDDWQMPETRSKDDSTDA